jgi:hypothetical protein
MGLLSLPTMLRAAIPELATGVIARSAPGARSFRHPRDRAAGDVGDLYSAAQETKRTLWLFDALTYLGSPAVLSVGNASRAWRCNRYFMRHAVRQPNPLKRQRCPSVSNCIELVT